MTAKIAKQRVLACIDHDAARAKVTDKTKSTEPEVQARQLLERES